MSRPPRVSLRPAVLGSRTTPLLAATALANLGDGVKEAAMPFLALTITANPLAIAALLTLQQLPYLLFGMLAGVLADRVPRRELLLSAVGLRVCVFGSLVVAITTGSLVLAHLYVAVFLFGLAEVLFDVTTQAILPELVAQHALTRANSWLSGAELVMGRFVGPPLGSTLFAAAPAIPFATAFGAKVLVLRALFLLPRSSRPARRDSRSTVLADIRQGLEYLWQDRLLRVLAIVSTSLNFLTSAWYSVLALYAVQRLQLGEASFGFFLLAGGLGGLLGSSLAGLVERRLGTGVVLPATVLGVAVSQLLLGVTSQGMLAAVFLAGYTAADAIWTILSTSLRQALIPTELLGRVNAAYRTLGRGMAPIGALAGGLMVSAAGIRTPFLVGAPLLAVAAVAAYRWVNPLPVLAPQEVRQLSGERT